MLFQIYMIYLFIYLFFLNTKEATLKKLVTRHLMAIDLLVGEKNTM